MFHARLLVVALLASGCQYIAGLENAHLGGDGGIDAQRDGMMPDAPDGAEPNPVVQVPAGTITIDTRWSTGSVYVLNGIVIIGGAATLTIEPGTRIEGEQGAALVIARGAKIMAEGTAAQPIVFTSAQPDGQKTRGFWGGVAVLGAAPINTNHVGANQSDEASFEAFPNDVPEAKFGGASPHDNSGILRYVRIELGGYQIVVDREYNNLTLAGVGDATQVDHVQVHGGSDDGIEIFGGTVNLKHIVSSQNENDGFDASDGWRGKAQFVVVQNVAPSAAAESSNGYELDNHAPGDPAAFTAQPRTQPTVYNVTLIGKHDYVEGQGSFATVLRRGTGGQFFNHVIMSFPRGLEVRDAATADQLSIEDLFIKSSIIFGNDDMGRNWPSPQPSNDIDEASYFTQQTWMNRFVDPRLPAAAFSLTAPTFKPEAGSPALSGGMAPPNDGFFDAAATFIGAVGSDDWTLGWTAYTQPAP